MASALLAADVPTPAVLSNSLLAAGVNKPGCARGVDGAVMSPVCRLPFPSENPDGDRAGVPERRDALARKEREAVDESL